MEIFALPYIAVSGVIGWVIFQPLLPSDDSESLTPAKLAITDLLAISLPVGVLFAFATWTMPENILSVYVQAIVVAIVLLFIIKPLRFLYYLINKESSIKPIEMSEKSRKILETIKNDEQVKLSKLNLNQ